MRTTLCSRRAAVVAALVAVLGAGCSSSTSHGSSGSSGAGGGQVVKVVLTSAGCTVDRATLPTGRLTFSITNTGNGSVTEVELERGGRILAERENIAPGLEASFSVSLAPGTYSLHCPGGSGPADLPVTVLAAATTTTATSVG